MLAEQMLKAQMVSRIPWRVSHNRAKAIEDGDVRMWFFLYPGLSFGAKEYLESMFEKNVQEYLRDRGLEREWYGPIEWDRYADGTVRFRDMTCDGEKRVMLYIKPLNHV